MNETELVEKLEHPDWQGPIERELISISDGRKAATRIRKLAAENEALSRDNKYLLKINQNLQRELIRLSY
jgi:hypothetical protein